MDYIKIIIYVVFFYSLSFIMLKLLLKKFPPYLTKESKTSDNIIVYAPYVIRHGSGGYIDYIFVKRKNGKYRMKLSIIDLIVTSVTFIGWFGIYFYVIFSNKLNPNDITIEMVLLFILLFVVFATVFMMLHISKVIALIYFKKLVKGLKM